MLLYSIVSNILSMSSLVEIAVAGCKRFHGSAPVAVGLSVMLNAAAAEGVSIVSGGSVKERE